jgi:hypothetical protein
MKYAGGNQSKGPLIKTRRNPCRSSNSTSFHHWLAACIPPSMPAFKPAQTGRLHRRSSPLGLLQLELFLRLGATISLQCRLMVLLQDSCPEDPSSVPGMRPKVGKSWPSTRPSSFEDDDLHCRDAIKPASGKSN